MNAADISKLMVTGAACLGGLVLAVGYSTGHITSDQVKVLTDILIAGHAGSSLLQMAKGS